jgi:hypothetical protein
MKKLLASWKHQGHIVLLVIYFLTYEIFKSLRVKTEISPPTMLVLLFGSVVFCLIITFTLRYLIKSGTNAVLLCSILFTITFFFSTWVDILLDISVFRNVLSTFDIHKKVIVFLFLLVIYGVIVLIIARINYELKDLSGYFTLLIACFIVVEIANFALYKPNSIKLENDFNLGATSTGASHPDIYYIILDHYSSNESLKSYNHDNQYFTDFLKEQGFYIATNSLSNYNYTSSSLSSSLNGSYLNVPNKTRYSLEDASTLIKLIKESKVPKILAREGYDLNTYGIYEVQQHSGKLMSRPDDKAGKSNSLLSTVLRAAFQRFDVADQQLIHKVFYNYNINSFKFLDSLAANVSEGRPKFNFMHTLTAHTPFVVDSNGNFQSDITQTHNKENYIREIRYTNKRIMSFIRSLKSNPKYKPVIIIQSDHGSHLNDLKETSTILNAYYFPDHDYSSLYPEISPVNSFRIIFNKYFNAQLPILPDHNFHVFYP